MSEERADMAENEIVPTVGYAAGGIIPGPKGQPVMIQAHAGERVLPRDVVTGFDRLASWIQAQRETK